MWCPHEPDAGNYEISGSPRGFREVDGWHYRVRLMTLHTILASMRLFLPGSLQKLAFAINVYILHSYWSYLLSRDLQPHTWN